MRRLFLRCAGVACLAFVVHGAALASPRGHENARIDPFERLNRGNFERSREFGSLTHLIARAYLGLTPGVIGKGLHNVLANLHEPVIVLNDLLQLRIGQAGEAAARTAFNSTLGVAGLIDIAAAKGNPPQKNSFADTMGRWGIGPGPYLFLPVLGPTTARDIFGSVVDVASDPLRWWRYPYNTDVNVGVAVTGGLDTLSATQDELDTLLGEAADPYATLRSVYLQSRQSEIDAIRSGSSSGVPAALPDLSAPQAPGGPQAPPPDAPASPAGEADPSLQAQLDQQF